LHALYKLAKAQKGEKEEETKMEKIGSQLEAAKIK
jgi:hypothetical protein